jgi:hypothetical protein
MAVFSEPVGPLGRVSEYVRIHPLVTESDSVGVIRLWDPSGQLEAEAELYASDLEQLLTDLASATAALALARKRVADAPHTDVCNYKQRQGQECSCWKAEWQEAKL